MSILLAHPPTLSCIPSPWAACVIPHAAHGVCFRFPSISPRCFVFSAHVNKGCTGFLERILVRSSAHASRFYTLIVRLSQHRQKGQTPFSDLLFLAGSATHFFSTAAPYTHAHTCAHARTHEAAEHDLTPPPLTHELVAHAAVSPSPGSPAFSNENSQTSIHVLT